jgi:hypothetical protein
MTLKSHKAFQQPVDPEVSTWRYMSLSKLAALLLNRGLHLSRLDNLEDQYEGTLPKRMVSDFITQIRASLHSERARPILDRSLRLYRNFSSDETRVAMERLSTDGQAAMSESPVTLHYIGSLFFISKFVMGIAHAALIASMEQQGLSDELEQYLKRDLTFNQTLEQLRKTGRYPVIDFLYGLVNDDSPITDEERENAIQEFIRDALSHYDNARRQLYVSCWHISTTESEAMWRIYCRRDDGVAVVLPYSRLRDSLTGHNTHIGMIKYIAYSAQTFADTDY